MKKTKLLSLTALLVTLGLSACNSTKEPEKKMFYGADENQHWLEDENKKIDSSTRSPHNFEDYAGDSRHTAMDPTCSEEGLSFKKCKDCNFVKNVVIPSLPHTYVKDESKSYAATCSSDGSLVEVCSVCNKENVTKLEKTGVHSFGEPTVIHAASTTASKLSKQVCNGCDGVDLVVDAMTYTAIDGKNKDSTNKTLKLDKNGNNVTYKFTVDKNYTNVKVALYGYIDYWKDGTNNNDQKGFFYNGSATFSMKVNGNNVEITNDKTFEEMGMEKGENGNGSYTLCYLGGTVNLEAGENTIIYQRDYSYNLNITEIHFVAC